LANKKRILILVADAGLGHRRAAEAIAAVLEGQYSQQCTAEIANPMGDERVPSGLRDSQSDYDQLVKQTPRLYELGYQASDAAVPSALLEGVLTVALFVAVRDLVREYQPDVVVTTYPLYQSPHQAVCLVSRHHVPLLTVVTDLATVHRMWFSQAAARVLVATQAVYDLAIKAGLPRDKVRITGIPVSPDIVWEKRAPSAIRAELGWRPDLTTLLVVGGKRVKRLDSILHVLNHSGMPLQLVVVAGGDDAFYEQLQRTEWHLATHLYNFVTSLPTMMRAADCILCKAGGLTVTESLACGLPLLLVDVLPGQEVGNAEYVVQGGAGELAEDPATVLAVLYHWLDQGGRLLAERARHARLLGRPCAAFRAAEETLAIAGSDVPESEDRPGLNRDRVVQLLDRHRVPWRDSRE
jgi:1,2-diacylglycerol 3-beta-galactosyltransferase